MTNVLDLAIASLAPAWALKRAQARRALAYYEAARPDRLRKHRRESGSGDTAVLRAGTSLREQARHLEQNHDLALNALRILVQNTVGAAGITVEPQPLNTSGDIHEGFAGQLRRLYKDIARRPEVTWSHDLPSAERMLAWSWYRDGEALAQLLMGAVPGLDHGTRVPFSIELLESDLLPMDFNDSGRRISMGVEKNAWGRPIGYHLYREHPGDALILPRATDLKRVPADRVLHLKMVSRIRQTRGVSIFAAVLNRLDDIKDYEESERIAAKVAASMAAAIVKGSPETYEDPTDGEPRELRFRPGMIFDELEPGESIQMIDSKRPNPNLDAFVDGQHRRFAGGVGTSASSLTKNYNGTYSAQRQEMVEQYGAYGILSAEFTAQFKRPFWEACVQTAVASGRLRIPSDLDVETMTDALYIGPQMPWIDPLKEASAWALLEESNYASGPEIIRRRGLNPDDVINQQKRWRRKLVDAELVTERAIETTVGSDPAGETNAQVKIHHLRA